MTGEYQALVWIWCAFASLLALASRAYSLQAQYRAMFEEDPYEAPAAAPVQAPAPVFPTLTEAQAAD
ncbi:MAG TPA: hypothetical protein VNT60_05680 [Deinococcales bacterium]|nr:hypothetical protein [Deinococcales bacterium]